VALRMKYKVARSTDELLRWNKDLKPGFHTQHWRVLETKGQRLILLIDWDSFKIIKEDWL
jgi:hypothetical protein